MKLDLNLNPKLLLLNQAVVLVARIVIIATLIHLLFILSMTHGVIVVLGYLVIEVMDLQLKYMVQNGVNDLFAGLLPKEKPNLTVVESTDDETKNETSH